MASEPFDIAAYRPSAEHDEIEETAPVTDIPFELGMCKQTMPSIGRGMEKSES